MSPCALSPQHRGLRFYPASHNAIGMPSKQERSKSPLNTWCDKDLHFIES